MIIVWTIGLPIGVTNDGSFVIHHKNSYIFFYRPLTYVNVCKKNMYKMYIKLMAKIIYFFCIMSDSKICQDEQRLNVNNSNPNI